MSTGHRIVGIVGSYRKHGTIDTAVTAVLEAAEAAGANTEKIYLQDQNIEFCTNCRVCLQQPGPERGKCGLDDDMKHILDALEAADAFVIGSPVNFGNVNALTQRFIERCVCYGYWPWGQLPKARKTELTKKAVLISSSAAPGVLARWLTSSMKTLRQVTKLLSGKPIGTLWIGMTDPQDPTLPDRLQQRAQKLGQQLAE
jgi:NAD(P)H-dependent FMN reductase